MSPYSDESDECWHTHLKGYVKWVLHVNFFFWRSHESWVKGYVKWVLHVDMFLWRNSSRILTCDSEEICPMSPYSDENHECWHMTLKEFVKWVLTVTRDTNLDIWLWSNVSQWVLRASNESLQWREWRMLTYPFEGMCQVRLYKDEDGDSQHLWSATISTLLKVTGLFCRI